MTQEYEAEIQHGPTPLDLKPNLTVCDCEFTPYVLINQSAADALVLADMEESTHYLRQCMFCGYQWYGHHCPHDGYQNPCSKCGKRPVPIVPTEYGD